eukprot:5455595-Pyramimonas_sp.AAC.1
MLSQQAQPLSECQGAAPDRHRTASTDVLMEDRSVLGDRVGDAKPCVSGICHGPRSPVQDAPTMLTTTYIFETFNANQGNKDSAAQEIAYGVGDSGALSSRA